MEVKVERKIEMNVELDKEDEMAIKRVMSILNKLADELEQYKASLYVTYDYADDLLNDDDVRGLSNTLEAILYFEDSCNIEFDK